MATSGSPFFNAQNVNYARSIGNIKAILPVVADIEKLGFVFARQMITNPHQSESSKTESYPMNPYFGSNTTPRTIYTMLHPEWDQQGSSYFSQNSILGGARQWGNRSTWTNFVFR